ncbi:MULTISPECIES: DUF6179 domain-containing protein [Dehalobacter]|jgi:hypothetical protein|uniref:Uncharacterized protein n=2 Tax=Dehalobacter restrictus TaxID=55583 RepID=A0A857DIC3_9FIRM|nr:MULTISPECIES: DUF6179 domain-containing protein [Dehalobacter]MCG1025288.1 hypothetical protein [Dehalobacter sp.]MDJ0306183.1 DUF6179 domain-containing protein [Dehalobacter sp.]OCZ51978.1 hypothetical protein A7D23_11825 [Dehalobacter sp. TeCB1]QHA00677.1 hypothetical protein GQ588_08545 [Dehalobacter restrictus]
MVNLLRKHAVLNMSLPESAVLQSLLEQAFQHGLLTDVELQHMQTQIVKLLTKQLKRFTHGDSCSVKSETAQSIMLSILYTIGIYLKSLSNPSLCLDCLKQDQINDLFQEGRNIINLRISEAKTLLSVINHDGLTFANQAYSDTLENGIPAFFTAYDPEFAAHETPGSIDYPLSNDQMDLTGIVYIHHYLQQLYHEDTFCLNFPDEDIQCLLRGYHDHSEDLLLNIFELVLAQSLGSVLAGKSARQLNISQQDREYLQQKLSKLPDQEFDVMLQNALTQVSDELAFNDRSQVQLLQESMASFAVRLKNALHNGRLEAVFITLKAQPERPAIIFEDGPGLADDIFRDIAEEIRQCRYIEDKLAIIRREIHSAADLADILEASCLLEDEYDSIYHSLTTLELALLIKSLPAPDPSFFIHSGYAASEEMKEWQIRLISFVDQLVPSERANLLHLVKGLTII